MLKLVMRTVASGGQTRAARPLPHWLARARHATHLILLLAGVLLQVLRSSEKDGYSVTYVMLRRGFSWLTGSNPHEQLVDCPALLFGLA